MSTVASSFATGAGAKNVPKPDAGIVPKPDVVPNPEVVGMPPLRELRKAALAASGPVFVRYRKLIPPQNRQLIVLVSNSKQQVDDFVVESTS